MTDVQRILRRVPEPIDDLVPRVYEELRALAGRFMSRERGNHTLQTTALVHEAYLRLVEQRNLDPADRDHFFAAAANTIRRILTDHARQRHAAKRGGDWERVTISDVDAADESATVDLLALDEALEKLAALDGRAARVVTMRYFGGLKNEQIAAALGVSERTIADDWATARAWLRRELEADSPGRADEP
jgi:RNA polymerase sigma factor (TIGR02999 family)